MTTLGKSAKPVCATPVRSCVPLALKQQPTKQRRNAARPDSPEAWPLTHQFGRAAPVLVITALLIGVMAACTSAVPATLTPTTGAATTAGSGLPPHALAASVESIVDGDTIVVSIGNNSETLRLLGIDTPEKPGGPRPAECYGHESTALLSQLIPEGTPVLLTRDLEPRDVYGRLLTYVFRAEDDLFVNLAILEAGAADTLNIAPNTTFAVDFQEAVNRARGHKLGLWATCGGIDALLE